MTGDIKQRTKKINYKKGIIYLSKKLKDPLEGFFEGPGELTCTLAVALKVDPEAAETWLVTNLDCLKFDVFLAFCMFSAHEIVAQPNAEDCALPFCSPTGVRFPLLQTSVGSMDLLMLPCRIFCFST